ncbi:MAG TPA: hypothetical protein VHO91_00220 [Rhodopila sp.]|nr:hypothetical protein [Rhodopila sp.]
MKKILLAATALVGFGAVAHAGSLPQNGFNAGSVSGSAASIGIPAGTSLDGTTMNGYHASVTTNGNAFSTSTADLSGGTSSSYSNGNIKIDGGGLVNGGSTTVPLMSASRVDQAYTAIGGTVTANVPSLNGKITYTNQTSALSGDSLSAQSNAGNGGWSNFGVTASGNSYSTANLGLPTTTASAYSNGNITGTADQQGAFTGQQIDNAASNVGVAGYASGSGMGLSGTVAGNLGAEANAGHNLSLSVPMQPQLGNYYYPNVPVNQYTASISDKNTATSTTTAGLTDGGLTGTSSSSSSDSLTGVMPKLGVTDNKGVFHPGNPGTFSGTSGVNAQTDMQLTGDLSGKIPGTNVSGSLNAGGYDGFNNQLNSPSN